MRLQVGRQSLVGVCVVIGVLGIAGIFSGSASAAVTPPPPATVTEPPSTGTLVGHVLCTFQSDEQQVVAADLAAGQSVTTLCNNAALVAPTPAAAATPEADSGPCGDMEFVYNALKPGWFWETPGLDTSGASIILYGTFSASWRNPGTSYAGTYFWTISDNSGPFKWDGAQHNVYSHDGLISINTGATTEVYWLAGDVFLACGYAGGPFEVDVPG